MPKPILRAAALFLMVVSSSPVVADPAQDAGRIAELTMSPNVVSGALAAMRPVIVGAMENEIRHAGITLSDPAAFADIVMEEFVGGYLDVLREEVTAIYLDMFTPDELAGIVAFYESEVGAAVIEKTPALTQRSAVIGAQVGAQAGLQMASRLRQRLREEGVTLTLDPEKQDELLKLLDEMAKGI